MNKSKCYRHGEICFRIIDDPPKGLKLSNTNIIMNGSDGHNHSFNKGKLYLVNEENFVFGYFVAEDSSLLHLEHSPNVGDAKLPDGIYQLIKQREYLVDGLKPIVD